MERRFETSQPSTPDERRRLRVNIDGVWLDRADLKETISQIAAACESHRAMRIVTANLNFITLARKFTGFREAINSSDLVVADGRWILFIARLAGNALPGQVTGHDIVRECIPLAHRRGYRIFLLGGVSGCVESLAPKLQTKYPGLEVGANSSVQFFPDGRSADDGELVQLLRTFAPNILFVGAGSPKAELWIARNLPSISPCVVVGIGGTFDTLGGLLPRAPRWMQVAGLEWFFRLLIRPRRYGRRYLLDDPPTLFRILGKLAFSNFRRVWRG